MVSFCLFFPLSNRSELLYPDQNQIQELFEWQEESAVLQSPQKGPEQYFQEW